MKENIENVLKLFPAIRLEEMSNVSLMNRIDTKFITNKQVLIYILQNFSDNYLVEIVNGERLIDYTTVYLDTPFREMYFAHQNGRKVREKIRVRTYNSSNLTFLEVKNKDNHDRTDKKRIRINGLETLGVDGADNFLQKNAWYGLSELKPQLQNNFSRITLVDMNRTERITFDMDICFNNISNHVIKTMSDLVIVEIKRDKRRLSKSACLMHRMHIRKTNVSKYCTGLSLTDDIKCNRFKPILMKIQRININNI